MSVKAQFYHPPHPALEAMSSPAARQEAREVLAEIYRRELTLPAELEAVRERLEGALRAGRAPTIFVARLRRWVRAQPAACPNSSEEVATWNE